MKKIVVTGAGGFIGSHLCEKLKNENNHVIGIDIKPPEYKSITKISDDFLILDLRNQSSFNNLLNDVNIDEVYHLAADMGGMGYVHGKDAKILQNNSRIDLNVIDWAYKKNVKSFLYTSSACRYPENIQMVEEDIHLKEDWAYPANPQDGYGWEKIFGELLCRYYNQNYGMKTHVVVFHNIYGEFGTWKGGREKSPAAICRKVAESNDGDFIEIWGDGTQLRSFCHVNDAVEGIIKTMNSDYYEPINIGTDRVISIKDFTEMIIKISNKKLKINYIDGPIGVKSRNSNNDLSQKILDWRPKIDLEDGIEKLYNWISKEIKN